MIHLNRALQRGMRLHRRPSNQVSELVVRKEGERTEQVRALRVRIAELEKELLETKVAEEYIRGKFNSLRLRVARAKTNNKNKDKAKVGRVRR